MAVDGFEGPLDWLLELARTRRIDLARLSIVAVVEAFGRTMDKALQRAPDAPAVDLTRWAAWRVMAAHLTELRSRLLPAAAPEARVALAEAEALRRQWLLRAQIAAAADWLDRRPQFGSEVFARGQPAATSPICCGPAWSPCACRRRPRATNPGCCGSGASETQLVRWSG